TILRIKGVNGLYGKYTCSAGRFAIYHLIGKFSKLLIRGVRFASVPAWLTLHAFPYWACGCRCYYWLVLERQRAKAYGCSSVLDTTWWRWSSEWDSGRGYLWDRRHVLGFILQQPAGPPGRQVCVRVLPRGPPFRRPAALRRMGGPRSMSGAYHSSQGMILSCLSRVKKLDNRRDPRGGPVMEGSCRVLVWRGAWRLGWRTYLKVTLQHSVAGFGLKVQAL
ncbi:hypothetical protein AB205_0220630, partial [Aquarana catesbeiana]